MPRETLSRSSWDLVPIQPGTEPEPPALGAWSQPLDRQGSRYNFKSIYQWFESPRAQRVDSGKSAPRAPARRLPGPPLEAVRVILRGPSGQECVFTDKPEVCYSEPGLDPGW